MGKFWLELRYGTGKAGITLYQLDDSAVIKTFARSALKRAKEMAFESEILDPILGIIDQAELVKLQQVLDLLTREDTKGQLRLNLYLDKVIRSVLAKVKSQLRLKISGG